MLFRPTGSLSFPIQDAFLLDGTNTTTGSSCPRGYVAALWADLITRNINDINYKTTGIAPYRTFVISYVYSQDRIRTPDLRPSVHRIFRSPVAHLGPKQIKYNRATRDHLECCFIVVKIQ